MLTQCPNPKCALTFDVPDERAGKNGPCPQCGQIITFRSLDHLKQMQRQRERIMAARPASKPFGSDPACAVLEDIRSMWNVGSMFRTADAAGLSRLFLCGISACPPRKEIAKTSLGAEEVIGWDYYPLAVHVVAELKSAGVFILGLEATETSILLRDTLSQGRIKRPYAMVVGNEVSGVSAEVLSMCDMVCHLPMHGVKQSLNVAVAFGIAAYAVEERLRNS